jgi:hypothetical protein
MTQKVNDLIGGIPAIFEPEESEVGKLRKSVKFVVLFILKRLIQVRLYPLSWISC